MDPIEVLFSDQSKFCLQVECLKLEMDRVKNDSMSRDRLDRLKKSIENCINNGRVYVYGSRLYGLAKEDSDVDLYVDSTDDCFSGKIADDCSQQIQLLTMFVKAANKEFIEIQVITDVRVPIVRFLHRSTNFRCDLQFRSGLAVLNSELIKLYLSMDERVRWVIVAVKRWAVALDIVNDDFSSYSLIWLVLFVMVHYKIVPPIKDLWRAHRDSAPNYTEGWDTRICFSNGQLVSKHLPVSNHTKWELLRCFFEFYSDSKTLRTYVLCTIFGELLPKKNFYSNFISKANAIEDYGMQITKFKKCENLINKNFGSCDRIELQNPLKLCNNVIPWLHKKNMKLFIDLCKKSANSLITMKI